jgi:GNAT superfamily N-acetyltransferase
MPLELLPMTERDTLSWTRIRALAYRGPTHDLLHNGPISESSILGVATDRKRDLTQPNTWHYKIIDTSLPPSEDDPPNNGGLTIAIAIWSMHNVKQEGSNEPASIPADGPPGFLPPELRLDALSSLLGPLRAVQPEIMGTQKQYLMLNSLATHPEHQGRGAAKILLDWGLKKADKEGLPVYLNATPMGRWLYDKRGFKVVRVVEWHRVPWGGEGKDRHECMVRDPIPLS